MSHEIVVVAAEQPSVVVTTTQAPAHQAALPPPTAERVGASDGVFSHESSGASVMAGLVGLSTSVLLLHDLAIEHFAPSADEAKREPKPRRRGGATVGPPLSCQTRWTRRRLCSGCSLQRTDT